ncbi:MAG: tetratricopeptide repeat protein [Bacteroidaceae bacterium]|nr:tetratricopeptide repeat protein [Bacteroidaceae bacterium]
MDQQTISMLKSMKDEHPYFHSARILLLQALYKHHSPQFDEELRFTAPLLPDRQAIFHLTEEPNYQKKEERRKFDTEDTETDKSQRTNLLISDFLESQPKEQIQSARYPIDATQDYIGFLLQNEAQEEEEPDVPMNGGGVVEDFLNQEPVRIVLKENETNTEVSEKKEEKEEENEILTETLAGIYIKQGKFENAIKIIRQLSLKYPKKNRYFADQIRFLEKLIINNKNK